MLGLDRSDVDELTTVAALSEENSAVNQCVKGVVLAHTHVKTGMMNSAALTLEDIASLCILSAENLNTESLAF